jgi:hypothetical protein
VNAYHDGEFQHVVLDCRSCDASLVDIIVTDPDADCSIRAVATCPFCGDQSFEVEVRGVISVGGCGEPRPDDPTDQVESTSAPEPDFQDDVVVFQVAKARPDAKPIRIRR